MSKSPGGQCLEMLEKGGVNKTTLNSGGSKATGVFKKTNGTRDMVESQ